MLQELFIERASRRGLVGNLYKGRVSRVLPGMQAAFIDIGLERTAFLHVSDIAARARRYAARSGRRGPRRRGHPRPGDAGDDILVQVLKDPLGTKGARLTTFIALPSRYLVYMPRGRGVGVSARIEDEAERARLKGVLGELVDGAGARAATSCAPPRRARAREALRADMLFLREAVGARAQQLPRRPAPAAGARGPAAAAARAAR